MSQIDAVLKLLFAEADGHRQNGQVCAVGVHDIGTGVGNDVYLIHSMNDSPFKRADRGWSVPQVFVDWSNIA